MIPPNPAYLTIEQIEIMCLCREVYYMTQEEARAILNLTAPLTELLNIMHSNYITRRADMEMKIREKENAEVKKEHKHRVSIQVTEFHFPD